MEVKISSSARPLQVQRSFEGPSPLTDGSTTAPSIRKHEFYEEEIHSRTGVSVQRPLTPAELINVADLFRVFVFALFVLAVTLFCIVTEDSVPLAYVLPLVSLISVVTFHTLKL